MTQAIYHEVSEKAEASMKKERRASVSGMLRILGVSRSGYHAWLKTVPTNTKQRKEHVKAKIKDIYDDSKQNYGAPKITKELRKKGEIIAERTVGKYMKEMGIKAQWVRPWTITTKDSDFSNKILSLVSGFEDIAKWASNHHEKHDGTGYPLSMSSLYLTIEMDVLAFADIFSALSEDRSYRMAMDKDEIIKIMGDLVPKQLNKEIYNVMVHHFDKLENLCLSP